ncbi:DNA mismatch repair protein, partial [Coemansia sp. RSA 551]
YNRIFEVASRYAIHNSGIAFTCRKAGVPKVDLNTSVGASTITNIRQIFGSKIGSSLVEIKDTDADLDIEFSGHVSSAAHEMHKSVFLLFINHRLVDHTPIRRAIEALYSSVLPKASRPFVYLDLRIKPENVDVNVHPTKREVRFLNEDSIINCIVDSIHNKLLSTNNTREFALQSRLQKQQSVISGCDTPLLTPAAPSSTPGSFDLTPTASTATPNRVGNLSVASSTRTSSSLQASTPQKAPVNKAVRTNFKTISLDSYSFGSSPSIRRNRVQTTIEPDFSVGASGSPPTRTPLRLSPSRANTDTRQVNSAPRPRQDEDDDNHSGQRNATARRSSENIEPLFPQAHTKSDATAPALSNTLSSEFPQLAASAPVPAPSKSYTAPKPEPRVEVRLSSILNLRKELQRRAHTDLTQVMSEHTFVGFVDDRRALIQHQTRLYMVDYCKISYHLFYHRFIFDFMNFGRLVLQPAPSIYELALMAATELGSVDAEKAAEDV